MKITVDNDKRLTYALVMNSAAFTLDQAKQLVVKAGHEVSPASWEDDQTIYACSVKSIRNCFNHPAFEVHFHKGTNWLTVDGQLPVKIGVAA